MVTDTDASLAASIRLWKAFSDPIRIKLVNLLLDGEVCVCKLHESLGLPQSTVSRHLAVLRNAGVVQGRRQGTWMHYSLCEPASELHRGLLENFRTNLASNEEFKKDRETLKARK